MFNSNWVCIFVRMGKSGVTTLLFDLGNVLFDLDIPATERAFASLLGDRRVQFSDWAVRNRFFERYEKGEITDKEFVETIGSQCQSEVSEDEVITAWNAMLIGMPESRLTWLKELRKTYQVALLSNTNALHITKVRQWLQQEHGIMHFEETYFDRVYYSHEIGARKPETRAYQMVIQDLETAVTSTLFIDDVQANIQGAQQLGIQAIWHKPTDEIRVKLPEYLALIK